MIAILGRTHARSAVALWIGVAPLIGVHDLGLIAAGAPITYAAGFLPDVDQSNSTAARTLGPVGRLISSGPLPHHVRKSFLIKWLARQLGPFGALLRGLKHRGASHWVSTWVVIGYIVSTTTTLHWLGSAVAIGGVAATLGDALTVDGSPLLGPLRCRPVRLPRLKWRWAGRNHYLGTFRTGGAFEKRVMMPAFTVAIPVLALAQLAAL